MKHILTVITLVLVATSSSSSYANDTSARAAAFFIGTAVGSAASGNPQGYYANPDPLRITRPQYNVIGGVMPLSKGGSLNPNRTTVTDKRGRTTEVTEYTDYMGNKHVEIEEY